MKQNMLKFLGLLYYCFLVGCSGLVIFNVSDGFVVNSSRPYVHGIIALTLFLCVIILLPFARKDTKWARIKTVLSLAAIYCLMILGDIGLHALLHYASPKVAVVETAEVERKSSSYDPRRSSCDGRITIESMYETTTFRFILSDRICDVSPSLWNRIKEGDTLRFSGKESYWGMKIDPRSVQILEEGQK